MTTPVPLWVAVLSGLLTPVIAIVASYVAWQQWRTNRNKLKLDLFDRRLAVYKAARSLIGTVLAENNVTNKQLFDYLSGTAEAHFLLDEMITRYLDEELYRKACALAALRDTMQGLPEGEERSRNISSQGELRTWFLKQHEALNMKFAPYLRLRH